MVSNFVQAPPRACTSPSAASCDYRQETAAKDKLAGVALNGRITECEKGSRMRRKSARGRIIASGQEHQHPEVRWQHGGDC